MVRYYRYYTVVAYDICVMISDWTVALVGGGGGFSAILLYTCLCWI